MLLGSTLPKLQASQPSTSASLFAKKEQSVGLLVSGLVLVGLNMEALYNLQFQV
jgi:hypothetical protein